MTASGLRAPRWDAFAAPLYLRAVGLRWLTGILPPPVDVCIDRRHVRPQSGAVIFVAGEIMRSFMQVGMVAS
jgi:hypothetical protein